MDKSQVIKSRQLIGENNLTIYTDATRWFNDQDEATELIWDDTNELLYVLRINTSYYDQNKNPLVFDVVQYSAIDEIISAQDKVTLSSTLAKLQTDGLIDNDRTTELINIFGPIANQFPDRITKTTDGSRY